jgi:hypothetical protein
VRAFDFGRGNFVGLRWLRDGVLCVYGFVVVVRSWSFVRVMQVSFRVGVEVPSSGRCRCI